MEASTASTWGAGGGSEGTLFLTLDNNLLLHPHIRVPDGDNMAGIFKAYDIRGTYPDQLSEDTAKKIGGALVNVLRAHKVVVGRDCRTSSPAMRDHLIKGMVSAGAKVLDIGLCSTDMLYFAADHFTAGAGVMITASHNPGHYNGFKMVRERVIPLSYETGIQQIEDMIASGRPLFAKRLGSVEEVSIADVIVDWFKQNQTADWTEPIKIVLDAGNGMGGLLASKVLAQYPLDRTEMYFEPDGSFPNHHPDPLIVSNLEDLSKRVLEEGAAFGVAFDGDSDRCVFVDDKGRPVPGDLATGLLAKRLLDGKTGEKVLYDLRASRFVKDSIESMGCTALESRVGHSYIKQTMRKEDAIFAGEVSGHYYFKVNGMYAENPLIPILLISSLISREGKTLSQILDSIEGYCVSGEINFKVADKAAAMEEAVKAFGEGGKVSRLDGVKVDFEDWWFNLRASNTEPLLRLNMEANTPELLEEKKAEVVAFLKAQE